MNFDFQSSNNSSLMRFLGSTKLSLPTFQGWQKKTGYNNKLERCIHFLVITYDKYFLHENFQEKIFCKEYTRNSKFKDQKGFK